MKFQSLSPVVFCFLQLSQISAFRSNWRFSSSLIIDKSHRMSSTEGMKRIVANFVQFDEIFSVESPPAAVVHQIFVGNLPFSVDEASLRSAVDEKLAGAVQYKSVRLQTDKRTGLIIIIIIFLFPNIIGNGPNFSSLKRKIQRFCLPSLQ